MRSMSILQLMALLVFFAKCLSFSKPARRPSSSLHSSSRHLSFPSYSCSSSSCTVSTMRLLSSKSWLPKEKKDQLLAFLDSKVEDEVYACPESLCSMTKNTRIFGFYKEQVDYSRHPCTKIISTTLICFDLLF